jgi:molybdenum cofactor biosynthesis enzyme
MTKKQKKTLKTLHNCWSKNVFRFTILIIYEEEINCSMLLEIVVQTTVSMEATTYHQRLELR